MEQTYPKIYTESSGNMQEEERSAVQANRRRRGSFITFEGCDGCGKSTQLKMFTDYLTEEEVPHIFTREPGGGKSSEAIRELRDDGRV